MTTRQEHWNDAAKSAAREGNDLAASLFALLARPSSTERGHVCSDHVVGFRRHGRRGLKCGICRKVLKWVDPAW